LGDAAAVIEQREEVVELHCLVVAPQARRRGAATRLLKALFSTFPGAGWLVAARYPEEIPAGLFTRLGFVEDAIRQQQMVLHLA
jgi:N-acetylglutamate synthase-like GNAT family acetyltransferase